MCKYCGQGFLVHQYRKEFAQYCSLDCFGADHVGSQHSPETIEKMILTHLGEKNPNWKGGISFEPYPTSWTEQLKKSIRTRDHHTCQVCDKEQEDLLEKLHVHHIDYDKKNLDPKNLISLCLSCHLKTNYNREQWKLFFQSKKE